MARQLDERQQADLTAFVNALAARGGYATTAEWSRDSGYPPSNLSNLRNGRGAVDGYNLLRLIRAAAERVALDPVELATELAAAEAESGLSIADRLRAVEDGVTELASEIRRALENPAVPGSSASRPETSRGGRAE